jgi:CBS domain-containing protein
MPIVDAGVLVGIVTRGDLLRRPPRGGPIGRFLHRFLHRGDPPDRVPGPGTPAPVASGPLRVCDIMTGRAGLVTVTERTPTEQARQLLTHNRFTALPVVDGDRLVGIVTEADLVRDPLDARRTPPPDTVGAAMTTDVIAAAPGTPVAALLSDPGPRLVPVVDGDRLVGVISRSDLLRAHTGHAT